MVENKINQPEELQNEQLDEVTGGCIFWGYLIEDIKKLFKKK